MISRWLDWWFEVPIFGITLTKKKSKPIRILGLFLSLLCGPVTILISVVVMVLLMIPLLIEEV